uniref:Renalase, FAD-dependent amine oxidase n=1 Tax=Cyprinus carpio TaxID=7962 RepID=A0A8C2GAJ1_CYPCA
LLRRELPNKAKISGCRGEMSTSRSPKDPSCTVDLGAQYISAAPYYARIHKMTRLFKDQQNTGAEVLYERHVTHIHQKDTGWEVCHKGGAPDRFDIVVVTMPVPQILQLQGDVESLIGENQRRMLEAVSYSSRYALGLFYKADTQIDIPWAAKYVSSNPCIRFIAIDDKKRNLALKNCGPAVMVHTSVPFGIQHLEEEKDAVQPNILEELEKVMPGLPQPDSIKCQKWRYSQVTGSVADCPGQMTLHSTASAGVCVWGGGGGGGGGGFTHSNFYGYIESALKGFEVLKSSL